MSETLQLILSLGGSAIISALIGGLIARGLNKAFERRDAQEKAAREKEDKDRRELEDFRQKAREAKEARERVEELKAAMAPITEKLEALAEKQEKGLEGILCTLRNDITMCYYKCDSKGYRNDYDYTNIHDMYEAYAALDGNSYVADLMRRFDDLPPKEDTVPTKVVERKVKESK